MVKLCIFDLDGTLLNTIEDLAVSTNYALRKHGLPVHDTQRYYHFVGNGIPKLIERASGYSKGSKEHQQVYDDFMQYYNEHSADKTCIYPGMHELLRRLCSCEIQCAVLSNKMDAFVRDLMRRFFPDIPFAKVLGKSERYRVKPYPDSLNAILEELQIDRADCLYIGDSDVDVQTAHNAGMPCIGVEWGFRGRGELEEAGADVIVSRAEEIFDCVQKGVSSIQS